jgi:predicted dithiol-disulfide oxidoreductase (DUF899 family)
MGELRFPNESKAYRDAREALLKEERELADKVKAVAAKRRTLPDGGQVKEDYVFQWASGGKVGQRVKFSELFGSKNSLLLYSFMFGPNWDKPCPSCTSLMDGFDRSWYQVSQDAAFAAIAKAPAERSALGRRSAAGRRSRCCQATARRFRRTMGARARRTTISRPRCMCSGNTMARFFISGAPRRVSIRCGRTGT